MRDNEVMSWLLEDSQPSVRYRALVDLLDRGPDDPEVRRARALIPRVGWAAELLRLQQPGGYWERSEPKDVGGYVRFLFFPHFQCSIWRAIVLADLGMTSADPRVRRTAEKIFEYKLQFSSPVNLFTEEVCAAGNAARTLIRFGYGEDRRVQKLLAWMLEDQREDGGWNCAANKPGTLDGWEAMAAFAEMPKPKRSSAMDAAVDRGAQFFLDRHLFEEGKRYPPWLRLHYPNHYYYDVLVGLDMITRLGFAGDRRLRPALEILNKLRRPDGTWALDRFHPDTNQGKGYAAQAKSERAWGLEVPGQPSKWITLTALRVLKRVESAS